jgi:hypothetical protein
MATMIGPTVLARTMSAATRRGAGKQAWQYHSRSDNHSKVACWTVLLDLLTECDVIRSHAVQGRLGFRINHVMVGPINKTLDLVVTVVPPGRVAGARATFADLVARHGIVLAADEADVLAGLPTVFEDRRDDVSEVAIALEAKACMTEHLKSLPRLHAEILATGYLARLAVPGCITASYSLVNAAATFISPGAKALVNAHSQPEDARRVVQMLATAVPLARSSRDLGYDVVGVTVIECRNDGSPVNLSTGDAAPKLSDHLHYERMIRSLCSEYRSRFR